MMFVTLVNAVERVRAQNIGYVLVKTTRIANLKKSATHQGIALRNFRIVAFLTTNVQATRHAKMESAFKDKKKKKKERLAVK